MERLPILVLTILIGVTASYALWTVLPIFRNPGRWGYEPTQVALLIPTATIFSTLLAARIIRRIQIDRFDRLANEPDEHSLHTD